MLLLFLVAGGGISATRRKRELRLSQQLTSDLDENGELKSVGIMVRPSPGKGLGAFASRHLPVDIILGDYTGEILSRAKPESTGDYLFRIDESVLVDAENLDKSCWTRYINHSSEPNLRVKSLPFAYGGKPRIWFVTLRDIEPGEELCFDYGPEYWSPEDEDQVLP